MFRGRELEMEIPRENGRMFEDIKMILIVKIKSFYSEKKFSINIYILFK